MNEQYTAPTAGVYNLTPYTAGSNGISDIGGIGLPEVPVSVQ